MEVFKDQKLGDGSRKKSNLCQISFILRIYLILVRLFFLPTTHHLHHLLPYDDLIIVLTVNYLPTA